MKKQSKFIKKLATINLSTSKTKGPSSSSAPICPICHKPVLGGHLHGPLLAVPVGRRRRKADKKGADEQSFAA